MLRSVSRRRRSCPLSSLYWIHWVCFCDLSVNPTSAFFLHQDTKHVHLYPNQEYTPGTPSETSWTDAMSKSLLRRLQSPTTVPCHTSISAAQLASSPSSTVPLPYITHDSKRRPMLLVFITNPTGCGLNRCSPADGILLDTGATALPLLPGWSKIFI